MAYPPERLRLRRQLMEKFVKPDPRRNRPSASGLERRQLCPGSANAERGLDDGSSDIGESGTKIHAALAGDVEQLAKLSSHEMTVYEHMREEVARLVEEHNFDPNRFIAEQRLWFPDAENPEFSGQPDRVYLNGPIAFTPDFKAGFRPPTPAPFNAQLAALAILTIHTYGVSRVFVALIPRFGRTKEVAEYDLESATAALIHIQKIISDSEKEDAPRVAGDTQCRWCSAKTRCPEYKAFVAPALAGSNLPAIPAEQLAMALDRCGAALAFIEELKAEGKRRLAAGDEEFSKLYELGKGRNLTSITNIVELYSRAKALGISDADFTQQCDIPFGVVKEDGKGFGLHYLVHKATQLNGKALKEKVKELLTGITSVRQSEGSLKRKEP